MPQKNSMPTFYIRYNKLAVRRKALSKNYLQAVNATADMTEINAKMSYRRQHK